MKLIDKIKTKQAKVSIIGMGYVGLPIGLEVAKAGFKVLGIDIDASKIKMLNKGKSYISDVEDNELKLNNFSATTDFSKLSDIDVIVICVPTPLRKTKEPDISYIVEATKSIAKYQKQDQLIILESTTYPGTTLEVVLPILTKNNMEVGKNFYLAFSPERVDPGNKKFNIKNTPKVVGGITKDCLEHVKLYYQQVVDSVIPVSSTNVAEMAKLLENTFRIVNIGLVNELTIMCDKMGIDVWEVIDAAATKPFGFMPFYPGPGLGGHCIPIDPYYLSWKAKLHDFNVSFIELAGEINRRMPEYVVTKIITALNKQGKCIKNSKILILGLSYKENVGDMRESPAIDILEELLKMEAEVNYNDPYIPKFTIHNKTFISSPISSSFLQQVDCVVIVTNHHNYDYNLIVDNTKLVIDTRNATKNVEKNRERIVKI